MACPVCPATGWLGGWIGGYFGVQPPEHPGGRILSAVITANLISITVIALKAMFNISLCDGNGFTLKNLIQIGVKTLVMGIIYSIGVNYLLNRFVFPQPTSQLEVNEETKEQDLSPPCCLKCKKEVEVK